MRICRKNDLQIWAKFVDKILLVFARFSQNQMNANVIKIKAKNHT